MAKAMYDPWSKIVTKNGYAGDEVISALQKSIRRAKEEDACMFAYEMYKILEWEIQWLQF